MKLDGGPGFDNPYADVGQITNPIHWDDANPTDLVLPNGGYARNFERIRDINTGSGNDVIICRGRSDNKISVRGGDDIVNPGLGNDVIVDSIGGYDTLISITHRAMIPILAVRRIASEGAPINRRRLSDNAIIDSIGNSRERLHLRALRVHRGIQERCDPRHLRREFLQWQRW